MRLERIECKLLRHAWDISVSPSYIIGCTGPKAVILNRQCQHIRTIDSLDHVCKAYVSPDENQVLLVSTGNRFYVADIASGEVRKVSIRSPFNQNLEGRGCWSHDGNHICIPVVRSESMNSTLRRYRLDDLSIDAEYLQDEYLIQFLWPLTKKNGYFMVARDRKDGHNAFIQMQGEHIDIIPLKENTSLINCYGCCLNAEGTEIQFGCFEEYYRYSLDGTLIEKKQNPFFCDEQPDSRIHDTINKYASSPSGKYVFMATNSGFYVLEAESNQLLTHIPEEYGVHNFELLNENIIAVATLHGVMIYQIVEKEKQKD